jgi:hypothetical protein
MRTPTIAARRWAAALSALALSAAALPAQTVVVTGDGSTFTSPAPSPGVADPSCSAFLDTWCARNVRQNAEVGITTDFPRSGNGSLYFESPSSTGKADFEYYFSSPFTLGQVASLAYDYFRSSASTNAANQVPSLRLALGPSAGFGYLIYEPVYNAGAFGTDTWHTAAIGSTSTFWLNGNDGTYRTLAQWQAGQVVGGRTVDANTLVIGLSTGVGSGWADTFVGAVDNVSYQTTGMAQAITYNFEVASVPEPQTYALMATGLLGVAAAAYRRRRAPQG